MADTGERGVVFGNRNAMHVRWRGGRTFSLYVGDDEIRVVEHDDDVADRDVASQVAHEIMRSNKHVIFR